MTEREPDDLYDALRDRLTDYGQEPPAPLWAGIRAQLPPPVAQPKLRPKRRAAVVLLLLLLVTASDLGWRWWHNQPLSHDATEPQLATVTSKNSAPSNQHKHSTATAAFTSPPSATSGAALRPGTAATSVDGVASSTSASQKSGTVGTVGTPGGGPTANEAASPSASATTGAKPARAAAAAGMLADGPTPIAARARKRPTYEATAGPATAIISGKTAAHAARAPKLGQYSLGREVAVNTPGKPGATSFQAAARKAANNRKATNQPLRASSISTNPAARKSFEHQPASGLETNNVAVRSAKKEQVQSPARQPGAEATAKAIAPISGAATPAANDTDVLTAQTLDQLQARTVALQLMKGLAPAQAQTVAVAPNEPPASFLPRWAVQVLAGPALTYRQLSSSSALSANPAPTTPSMYPGQNSQSTASIAELERPALGGGFQLTVRRALTERWSLSAGLGYAEYATRLALQQVQAAHSNSVGAVAPRPDSSTTSIHRRDTYRFVTVPLRVGYTKPLSPRWSVGLLAGADVALYVGGSSTEGSACACQTRSWGLTGSPYRRVSVGASLGAEVRYRLNGRWELLAQPTATYMLNPLAQSTSAYYRRHLLGGTALLGAAYTLP
jgi:hypothetical protein